MPRESLFASLDILLQQEGEEQEQRTRDSSTGNGHRDAHTGYSVEEEEIVFGFLFGNDLEQRTLIARANKNDRTSLTLTMS